MNPLKVPLNMENKQFIKVWDIAIRVFHWTLVGCFAIAFISSENILKLHVIFGYSVLLLVIFRIFYGFVGTKYARFSDFLYPPAQIAHYLKGLSIHVIGVFVSRLIHRENLIKAMITGLKQFI